MQPFACEEKLFACHSVTMAALKLCSALLLAVSATGAQLSAHPCRRDLVNAFCATSRATAATPRPVDPSWTAQCARMSWHVAWELCGLRLNMGSMCSITIQFLHFYIRTNAQCDIYKSLLPDPKRHIRSKQPLYAPTWFRMPWRLMLLGRSIGRPSARSQMSCARGPRPRLTPKVAV
jgi:hypothetical protein